MKTFILLLAFSAFCSFSQSDTLNQIDSLGQKQGYWIVYGYMKPEKGYADSVRIEEGPYLNNRKDGCW